MTTSLAAQGSTSAARRKLVIIGGVAGGMSAAARARRLDEHAEIVVLEQGAYVSFANCGLPYHLSGEIARRDALLLHTPASLAASLNLDVRTRNRVTGIDRDAQTVTVQTPEGDYLLAYDALILAPGAVPFKPPVAGLDHPAVHALRTVPDVDALRSSVDGLLSWRPAGAPAPAAVVVGAGFIGLEAVEALVSRGMNLRPPDPQGYFLRSNPPFSAAFVQVRWPFVSTSIQACPRRFHVLRLPQWHPVSGPRKGKSDMSRIRRERGEGTLYFDAGKDRWIGQLDLGTDPTGKRHRPRVAGKTRAEAKAKLAELRDKREAGLDLSTRAMTFAQLVDAFLERGLPADLTANTRSNYERLLHLDVTPHLGHIRLLELKSDHVETMLDAMASDGMSASSMRHALNLTRRALRFAMLRDLVIRNVAQPVQTPRGPKAERFGLTVDQAKSLLAAAAGERLANMLTLCLLLGLRPGEASALTWAHVSLEGDRPTITIAANLRRTPTGELLLVAPKTATSRRTLEIPPPVVAALRAQRLTQHADAAAAGVGWQNTHDLVFTTEVGTPLDPSNVRRAYTRIAKTAGIAHLHPHMLRHAAASLLSAAGVPIEDISDTLGHRSVTITAEIYRHPIAPSDPATWPP